MSATELPHRLIGFALLVCAGVSAAQTPVITDADIERARKGQPAVTDQDIEAARRKHNATVQVPAPQTGTSSQAPRGPSSDALPQPATRTPIEQNPATYAHKWFKEYMTIANTAGDSSLPQSPIVSNDFKQNQKRSS